MQVSKDVVFNEISYWYGLTKVTKDVDVGNGNVVVNIEQQTQSLSGPGEPSNNGSNAWTGRLPSSGSTDGSPDSGAQISRKGKEKVDPPPFFDVSYEYSRQKSTFKHIKAIKRTCKQVQSQRNINKHKKKCVELQKAQPELNHIKSGHDI